MTAAGRGEYTAAKFLAPSSGVIARRVAQRHCPRRLRVVEVVVERDEGSSIASPRHAHANAELFHGFPIGKGPRRIVRVRIVPPRTVHPEPDAQRQRVERDHGDVTVPQCIDGRADHGRVVGHQETVAAPNKAPSSSVHRDRVPAVDHALRDDVHGQLCAPSRRR